MRNALALITLLLTSHGAQAQMLVYVPYELLCAYPFLGDRPFVDTIEFAYQTDPNFTDADRARQMHAISVAYVKPAAIAACKIKRATGDHVVKAAGDACDRGCRQINTAASPGEKDWNVRLQSCLADCGQAAKFLRGMEIGHAMRKVNK